MARLDAGSTEVLGEDEGEDELQDTEEIALAEAYRALGISEVRLHRLGLRDGAVARHEADVVAAISEIVGFVEDPGGLGVLAPWSGDGDDDHEAAVARPRSRARPTACGWSAGSTRHGAGRARNPPRSRGGGRGRSRCRRPRRPVNSPRAPCSGAVPGAIANVPMVPPPVLVRSSW